jgi:hypothetical protein
LIDRKLLRGYAVGNFLAVGEVNDETHAATQTRSMVYPRFGTRNCSWLGLVVRISDGFVGSKYRHSDDNNWLWG